MSEMQASFDQMSSNVLSQIDQKGQTANDDPNYIKLGGVAPLKPAPGDRDYDVSAERLFAPSQRTYALLLLRPNGTFAYVINSKANVKSLTDGDAPGDMRVRGTYLEDGNVCTLKPMPPSIFRAGHPEITMYEDPDDEPFSDGDNSELSSFKVVLGDQPSLFGAEGQVALKMNLPAEAKDSWMNPDYEE